MSQLLTGRRFRIVTTGLQMALDGRLDKVQHNEVMSFLSFLKFIDKSNRSMSFKSTRLDDWVSLRVVE